ncbi:hypothetical protein PUN28_017366 [Cardiocondyla obscurior]|uniref:Uncharacterized protein n=1 Tax=Cardiocondyla obscurior TaxID=286306 RepID=A0AAW2ENT0_9HYME
MAELTSLVIPGVFRNCVTTKSATLDNGSTSIEQIFGGGRGQAAMAITDGDGSAAATNTEAENRRDLHRKILKCAN